MMVPDSWLPRVLLLGPGGIKTLKILGFLTPLEDEGMMTYLDTYCGVSAGALISLLLVAGYSIRETITEAMNLDAFWQIGSFDLGTMLANKGLLSHEKMENKISQLVLDKLGSVPSLQGLYLMTGKALITVTLRVDDCQSIIMTPESHPDISCVEAVLDSMNIAFLFQQRIYRGHSYIDGIFADPYPLEFFDNGETDILGIYLQTFDHVSPETEVHAMSLDLYADHIIQSIFKQKILSSLDRASVRCRNICLRTNSFNPLGWGLTLIDKITMLAEGYKEGKEFLETLDLPRDLSIRVPQKYSYPPYYSRRV